MGRVIYGETEQLMRWAGPANDAGDIPADTVAIGLEVEGDVRAVVYFNDFTTTNCNMHVVTRMRGKWLSRGFLAAAFMYPFAQVGLRRVTGLVNSRNMDALTLNLKLGFQVEGRMIEAAEDGDMVVLGMLRRNCIWIPEEYRHG
ncbi:GNAT family N-acetyltransferase [Agrobacterium tumefaciens]|uniref:GNAT family N-acetyltransferase n=1 Tax=Agrobacterium tumefaciens TaxID=358 RepID=UPI001574831D|nr:GNAT family N-acetyltransferase [Agrobacterium tumefaciens]